MPEDKRLSRLRVLSLLTESDSLSSFPFFLSLLAFLHLSEPLFFSLSIHLSVCFVNNEKLRTDNSMAQVA